MSDKSYLQVSELDFDEIRNNLKNYLSTQERFKDYNFEGSSMAVLLDLLAYNTHYGSYYLNMLANEMFLDTAQQRESVVSRANELGYTSYSSEGSQISGQITFFGINEDLVQITVPKYSTFTAVVDNKSYNFVTVEDYVIPNFGGAFSSSITIKEGIPLVHQYVVNTSVKQRFYIPNDNVDTTSIVVRVQDSAQSSIVTEFTRATNVRQIFQDSPIYFLEEYGNGKYEIVFGDGILGKALKNNNIVYIEYLYCHGDETNNIQSFSIGDMNIGTNYDSVRFVPEGPTRGGHWQESIESIKFNAPKSYQTQNRAIIANDYARIITEENPDIQSVISFGGEESEPAVYGKVYVAVKPYGEEFVTEVRRNQLRDSIMDRTPLSVDPVIIDGEYTYIVPTITIYYDATTTTDSEGFIVQTVREALRQFSLDNLERFGNKLRYSKMVAALDSVSAGNIFNNEVSIKLEKRFLPNINVSERVTIRFHNSIRKGSIESTLFTYKGYSCYLEDDEEGNIDVYRYDTNGSKVIVENNKGTVNYSTGEIDIINFDIQSYSGIEMSVFCEPLRLDVTPIREQILVLDSEHAEISTVSEYS